MRFMQRDLVVVGLLALAACSVDARSGDDKGNDTSERESGSVDESPLAIRGSYADPWGLSHVVDDDSWTMTSADGASVFAISSFSNAQRYAVAHNAETNGWAAGLWSRFDWTYVDGDLWYCQTAYDAASESDALAFPSADASDPQNAGCGPSSWTLLIPLGSP